MPKDWIVLADGQCQVCPTPRDWDLLETPYRFHRFLTAVEDVLKLAAAEDQTDCLPDLRRLVRKLVLNSYWLRTQRPEPSPLVETAILNLYDEIGYPLTVQIETLLPGAKSSVHNHGTWGVVAVLQGQESNQFWRREPHSDYPDAIALVEQKILTFGDVIGFTPEAIHSIEAVGDEPLVTFNLYGETHSKHRFEFDPVARRARNY
ncbi:cupin [Nodosilinea sp. LEGE 07088]|uniref:cysteine dioxygenase family protein n=1 Tax=Nodosilinea sp. LEGE 07088 TaxID=2777968 RepID=UPI0018812644|nr:cupin [Nodosilinea sp. LEGE 07088]MBE9140575.1 cupin [Nodosilinea sp. LEGE 07088]